MSNHIPGPWLVNQDGRTIFTENRGSYESFASVSRLLPLEEMKSTARLIAAAPDLLQALEQIAAMSHVEAEIYVVARAAIAKAKGE